MDGAQPLSQPFTQRFAGTDGRAWLGGDGVARIAQALSVGGLAAALGP